MNVNRAPTGELSRETLAELKRLCEQAYGAPLVEDWDHALGGTHFFVEEDGRPVAHAAVVKRRLRVARTALRTGYVEALATHPDRRGRGYASRIMRAVTEHVRVTSELGGLCTGLNDFFARFGWETWAGPTFVRTSSGLSRTEHEDGNVMVLRTASTSAIDLGVEISCEWRPGDVW